MELTNRMTNKICFCFYLWLPHGGEDCVPVSGQPLVHCAQHVGHALLAVWVHAGVVLGGRGKDTINATSAATTAAAAIPTVGATTAMLFLYRVLLWPAGGPDLLKVGNDVVAPESKKRDDSISVVQQERRSLPRGQGSACLYFVNKKNSFFMSSLIDSKPYSHKD